MNSVKNHLFRLSKLCAYANGVNNGCIIRGERCFRKTSIIRKEDSKSESDLAGSAASKYEIFVDEKSPIIFDIEQEREKFYEINDETVKGDRRKMDLLGINPQRGTTGVIEVEELVAILKRENAFDVVVIEVPKIYSYVEYMVIASGKSKRHMNAIAEFVRKVYKFKTSAAQGIPTIEGKNSADWLALDLGNIALHVMSRSARVCYDLESLWSVGKEFDFQSNMKETNLGLDYESMLSSLLPAANT